MGMTFNKGSVIGTAGGGNCAGTFITVNDESAVFSNHWTVGVGVHLTAQHSFWLRYGVNDPATGISGTRQEYSDELSFFPVIPFEDFI